MSDATRGPVGQLTLRLTLPGGAAPALGYCLIGVIELEAVDGPAEANARLNLVEGDLWIDVEGPAGRARIGWPWPVDSGARRVTLAPGERLVAAVPLFATDTSAPALPVPGRYRLIAQYHSGPSGVLTGAPVAVTCAPGDAAASRALGHRDVLQSLLSAGTLGAASDGLAVLSRSDDDATRALAFLALGQAVETSEGAVRALAAVLPPHASPDDPRRAAALAAADDPQLRAMLTGEVIDARG
ncbi:hypothetical protein [Microbacterium sp. Marseille-Q6648]|uniref:hypothetical protein n=1 Tax=Microbacterium sp. Marseille-Q6648 TaxID=2937991 RepID=UPI00203B5AB4|nr:hypothetical protein [Microbacterium sp. Marseille-Q6648]